MAWRLQASEISVLEAQTNNEYFFLLNLTHRTNCNEIKCILLGMTTAFEALVFETNYIAYTSRGRKQYNVAPRLYYLLI